MDFHFRRSYRGRLKAAILDWAGTSVDYGSFAPTAVFMQLFARHGVPITVEQARAPMGLMKRDHLWAIARLPAVERAWREVHGHPPADADLERMFADFIPLQLACLADYADLIPGTREAVQAFRQAGMQIGSTTGYTRELLAVLLPEARRRGYAPDACVCPSDVPAGRPFPWMIYQNAIQLQVYPLEAVVKIGDTLPDIEEGLNAGAWTVGLALSGNGLGLTQAEAGALPPEERQSRRAAIAAEMYRAGAHYVVDGIWDVPALIQAINARLAQGERP